MDPITFNKKRGASGQTGSQPDFVNKQVDFAFNPFDESGIVGYTTEEYYFSDPAQNTLSLNNAYTTDFVNQTDISSAVSSAVASQVPSGMGVDYATRYKDHEFYSTNTTETMYRPYVGKRGVFEASYNGIFAASDDQSKIVYMQANGVSGTQYCMVSTDGGETWTEVNTGINNYNSSAYPRIYWQNDRFICKYDRGVRIWQSTDGVNWFWENDTNLFNGMYVVYDFIVTANASALIGTNSSGNLEVIWSNDLFKTHNATYVSTANVGSFSTFTHRRNASYGLTDDVIFLGYPPSGSSRTYKLTFTGTTWSVTEGSPPPLLAGRNTNGPYTAFSSIMHDPVTSKYYGGAVETGFSGGGVSFPVSSIYSSTDGLSWSEIGSSVGAKISSTQLNRSFPIFVTSTGDVYSEVLLGNQWKSTTKDSVVFVGGTRYSAGYSDKFYNTTNSEYNQHQAFVVQPLIAGTDQVVAYEYNYHTGKFVGFRATKNIHRADESNYVLDTSPTAHTTAHTTSSYTLKESADGTTWQTEVYNITPALPSAISFYGNPIILNEGKTSLAFLRGTAQTSYGLYIGENDGSGTTEMNEIDAFGTLGVSAPICMIGDYSNMLFSMSLMDNSSTSAVSVGAIYNMANLQNQNASRLGITTDRFNSFNAQRAPSDDIDMFPSGGVYDPSAVGTNGSFQFIGQGQDPLVNITVFHPFYGAGFGGEATSSDKSFLAVVSVASNDGTNVTVTKEVRVCKIKAGSTIEIGTVDVISSIGVPVYSFLGNTSNGQDPIANRQPLVFIQSNQKGFEDPATKVVFTVYDPVASGFANHVYDVASDTFTAMTGIVPGTSVAFNDVYIQRYNAEIDKFIGTRFSNRAIYVLFDTDLSSGTVIDNPLGF